MCLFDVILVSTQHKTKNLQLHAKFGASLQREKTTTKIYMSTILNKETGCEGTEKTQLAQDREDNKISFPIKGGKLRN